MEMPRTMKTLSTLLAIPALFSFSTQAVDIYIFGSGGCTTAQLTPSCLNQPPATCCNVPTIPRVNPPVRNLARSAFFYGATILDFGVVYRGGANPPGDGCAGTSSGAEPNPLCVASSGFMTGAEWFAVPTQQDAISDASIAVEQGLSEALIDLKVYNQISKRGLDRRDLHEAAGINETGNCTEPSHMMIVSCLT